MVLNTPQRRPKTPILSALLLLSAMNVSVAKEPIKAGSNFAKPNLVAWCIVAFDHQQRSPAERCEMAKRLGLRRIAYDWRDRHVSTFEEEIRQYQQHDIEYFAFWDWHDEMEPLIRKYGIRPQIWKTCREVRRDSRPDTIRATAEALLPHVDKTKTLGLKFGLYNHGGWGGEPENLVAVCRYLRNQHNADHVGIVYNFHHAHDHIHGFATALELMKPMLLCVNLNGMADVQDVNRDPGRFKILPVGKGRHERDMIETVIRSGYEGPIGIIGHRANADVEVVLRDNIRGLSRIARPELHVTHE